MNKLKGKPIKKGVACMSFSVLLLACASQHKPPLDLMSQAKLSIQEAEQAHAQEAAPLEMTLARDKLDKAEKAMSKENYLEARRMAEQSLVDSDLARSKVKMAQTKNTKQETEKTIQSLEQETRRP